MDPTGNLIRLYPVPFRLIGDDAQFKKWQWITARIEKNANDQRHESHRIAVDTIVCDSAPLSTRAGWRERRNWLDKVPIFEDFADIEGARIERGTTLAILRPSHVLAVDITPADQPDWTEAERQKLLQLQQQGSLFEPTDPKSISTLRKVPFDFHYRYRCVTAEGAAEYRHKIVDWEAGALYWKVRRSHGEDWQTAFRAKLATELPARDLMFLLGTIHRFPNQWLIVSLIYPPKPLSENRLQGSLL
jgi:hypothetical protein